MGGKPVVPVGALAHVVVGRVMLDEITLADQTRLPVAVGGAAAYAAVGAAMAAARLGGGRVGLVSTVGADLDTSALDRAGVDLAGLTWTGPTTTKNSIRYRPDGSRDESPVYGFEHFRVMTPSLRLVSDEYRRARSVYYFGGLQPSQFDETIEFADTAGALLNWEVEADLCVPERRDDVEEMLAQVDLVSLNRAEAHSLLGIDDPYRQVRALLDGGAPVVALRAGADGSFVGSAVEIVRVGAPSGPVVDPTGAGNAYSGAFGVAYDITRDLAAAGHIATAAAAAAIAQHGLPSGDRDADTDAGTPTIRGAR